MTGSSECFRVLALAELTDACVMDSEYLPLLICVV